MTIRSVLSRLWPLLALAGVGWLDYLTGPMLPFFHFYLVVLVLVALRRRWPEAVAFAVIAAAILFSVDFFSLPELRWSLYPYWRASGHLLSFGLVAFTIPRLIDERRRLAESEALLIRQRREIHELNTALVQALEDRAGERERAIEELVGDHALEIRNLREVVEQLRTSVRGRPPP